MGCGVCGRDDCDRGESVYMGRYLVNHAVFDNPKTFLFFSCLLPRTRGFFPFVFFFLFVCHPGLCYFVVDVAVVRAHCGM